MARAEIRNTSALRRISFVAKIMAVAAVSVICSSAQGLQVQRSAATVNRLVRSIGQAANAGRTSTLTEWLQAGGYDDLANVIGNTTAEDLVALGKYTGAAERMTTSQALSDIERSWFPNQMGLCETAEAASFLCEISKVVDAARSCRPESRTRMERAMSGLKGEWPLLDRGLAAAGCAVQADMCACVATLAAQVPPAVKSVPDNQGSRGGRNIAMPDQRGFHAWLRQPVSLSRGSERESLP